MVQARSHRFRAAFPGLLNASVLALWSTLWLSICTEPCQAMRIYKAWTTKHWCNSVFAPHWPFAYKIDSSSSVMSKGRTVSNYQHLGHVIDFRGALTKTWRCEAITCNSGASTCQMQIQGMDIGQLPINIPTVSDVAFAVGGSHRYDFGNSATSRTCVLLTEKHIYHTMQDFSDAVVRCWGYNHGTATPGPPTVNTDGVANLFYMPLCPNPSVTGSLACGGGNGAGDGVAVQWAYSRTLRNFQGEVGLLAGSGSTGAANSVTRTSVSFNDPSAIAMDENAGAYIADTTNNCIRYTSASGATYTVAGLCDPSVQSFTEGAGGDARFSRPQGITMYYDTSFAPKRPVVIVADTDNHRIRKLVANSNAPSATAHWTVSTLSGRSGLPPHQGFADGDAPESRFSFPTGVSADSIGNVFVADTYNHLIRHVATNGTVRTLAGTLVLAETDSNGNALPGCPAPCLKGVKGFADGSLTTARFFFPADVAIDMGSGTVTVADHNRIRRISLPSWVYAGTGISTTQTVQSRNRVVTIAGNTTDGHADGIGQHATFHTPKGVTVTSDSNIYVADFAEGRIRRIRTADTLARNVACTTTLNHLVRPSGCTSYEEPVDALDLMATPVRGDTYFNHGDFLSESDVISPDVKGLDRGRRIRNCLGVPPRRRGLSSSFQTLGPRLGTSTSELDIKEQTDDLTEIKVKCPASCTHSSSKLIGGGGSTKYGSYSSVCAAAVHAGIITASSGGLVAVKVQEGPLRSSSGYSGSTAHGLTSTSVAPSATDFTTRAFDVHAYPVTNVQVETIAGFPSAPLQSGQGYSNEKPPLYSKFQNPAHLNIFLGTSLTASSKMYIVDQGNQRIRTITASCQQVCENGGTCSAPETCTCPSGWSGVDCTTPVCSGTAPPNKLCTGPDLFTCKPGYTGTNCDQAMCVQTCENGGSCSAPDTCSCASGWFDVNCTTPVCSQTCGNGGNCTSPNVCTCPSEWSGSDCRTPVCSQGCNTGLCVAPDTCVCPPKWSGFDCSRPVCTQGEFVPFKPGDTEYASFTKSSTITVSDGNGGTVDAAIHNEYVPCGYADWCNATNGFTCSQPRRLSEVIDVQAGPAFRHITGRNGSGYSSYYPSVDPLRSKCLLMELDIGAFGNNVPFQFLNGAGDATPHWRYPPSTPYPWDGGNVWSSPSSSASDRLVALVELRSVVQGKFVCANGGVCTAPDTCYCTEGSWMGFDCRIPICSQGYHSTNFRATFGSTVLPPTKIDHPDGQGKWADRYQSQSGYVCSVRSVTEWENPSHMWDHPNYFSRYMDVGIDVKTEDKAVTTYQGRSVNFLSHVYFWEQMGYGNPYSMPKTETGNDGYGVQLDDTLYGWKRWGTWKNDNSIKWELGECRVEYRRTCGINEIQEVVVTSNNADFPVQGKFKLAFEGDISVDEFLVEDSAEDFQRKFRKLSKVPNVLVSKETISITPLNSAPAHYVGCASKGGSANPQDGCFGFKWRVTFIQSTFDLPPIRVGVSRNGDYRHSPFANYPGSGSACDDNRQVECSLRGGFIDNSVPPPVYSGSPGSVSSFTIVNGSAAVRKSFDRRTMRVGLPVLDTDDAFRARVTHTNEATSAVGRWEVAGGECTDFVYRGCYNNGTCVAPGVCACSPGWTGHNCTTPICERPCMNGGKCTLPNTCTCEKGWAGPTCETPLCAQECNNRGKCVLPDQCQCNQWDNEIRDSSKGGGRPKFKDETGDPAKTGWTGFDCSTPICVQAPEYGSRVINVGADGTVESKLGFVLHKGAGGEDTGGRSEILFGDPPINNIRTCTAPNAECTDEDVNAGKRYRAKMYVSYKQSRHDSTPAYYLHFDYLSPASQSGRGKILTNKGTDFPSGCEDRDAYLMQFQESGYTKAAGRKSGQFLCGRLQWEEGDYTIGQPTDLISDTKLAEGRNPRVNFPNLVKCSSVGKQITLSMSRGLYTCTAQDVADEKFYRSTVIPGEGFFTCKNRGSCIGPDNCTCPDGYSGFDCGDPVCRHLQPDPPLGTGLVKGCLNGGVCVLKDSCKCILSPSLVPEIDPYSFIHPSTKTLEQYSGINLCPLSGDVLPEINDQGVETQKEKGSCVEPSAPAPSNMTGFVGKDCAIPVCAQGFYVRDLDGTQCVGVSQGGEGCYKCSNGGNCTAPDYCTCPPEWTGYNCETPVCTAVANDVIISDLATDDTRKILDFELDPCRSNAIHQAPAHMGKFKIGQGNCTAPDRCTCLCKESNPDVLPYTGSAWFRLPIGMAFGFDGFTGLSSEDRYGHFPYECSDGYVGASSDAGAGSWIRSSDPYSLDHRGSFVGNWNGAWAAWKRAYPGGDPKLRDDPVPQPPPRYFISCHLEIWNPTWAVRNFTTIMVLLAFAAGTGILTVLYIRRRIRQRELIAKAERRRSRKSSERMSRLSRESRDSRRNSSRRTSSRRASSGRRSST